MWLLASFLPSFPNGCIIPASPDEKEFRFELLMKTIERIQINGF